MFTKNCLAAYALIIFLLCSCDSSINPVSEIDYQEVSGYHLKSSIPLDKSPSFMVINNQLSWENMFYVISDHVDANSITTIDFNKYFVICIIKREAKYWEIKPELLSINSNEITYKYRSKCINENLTWIASIESIIMVKRCSFQEIKFYENDNVLYTYAK